MIDHELRRIGLMNKYNLFDVGFEKSELEALLQLQLLPLPEVLEMLPGGVDVVDQLADVRHRGLEVCVRQGHR